MAGGNYYMTPILTSSHLPTPNPAFPQTLSNILVQVYWNPENNENIYPPFLSQGKKKQTQLLTIHETVATFLEYHLLVVLSCNLMQFKPHVSLINWITGSNKVICKYENDLLLLLHCEI